MKIAIITPIGPGHESAYEECKKSIDEAWQYNPGLFTDIKIMPLYDLDGKHGRSRMRNLGISQAMLEKCDWIFFLDADDLLNIFAFELVSPYLIKYDAVWGNICECPYGNVSKYKVRNPQIKNTEEFSDILRYDPYLTLQMGHFVKAEIVNKVQFDEDMNTGEDFKYYLEICEKYKFIKTPAIFFINQRGNHSEGPKSGDGREWRINVEREIETIKNKFLKEMEQLNIAANKKTAIVVAHPDDEVLWAGGLMSRFQGFDIIVCSTPFRDPERIKCFQNVVKAFEHNPIILPYKEEGINIPLNLNLLNLEPYDVIFTHNKDGEYGHPHHKQLHHHITQFFKGKIYAFGYGFGDQVLKLSKEESSNKLKAIKYYNNKRDDLNDKLSWEILLETQKIDFDNEWYITVN
jgi:hypothetical protein